MSYDIRFKVKVEGVDAYVEVGECEANTTWNLREMIVKSTGLEWKNCENNGLCVDVIPHIFKGLEELTMHPGKYKEYEDSNGWGTVHGARNFLSRIIEDWQRFNEWYPELAPIATFWIE